MSYTKGYWLNDYSRTILSRGYLLPGETAEQRIRGIADTLESILGIEGYADKFEDYMLRGWFSLSSPIWANMGRERGLPISCNGSYIGDSIESMMGDALSEVHVMTKLGAGTSGYFGDVRPRGAPTRDGGTAPGPVNFMRSYDVGVSVVSQSDVRRGNFAAYLDADHPDVLEFLKIRSTGHPIQNMSIGVVCSDEFMSKLGTPCIESDIWVKILEKRYESGYPYVMFGGNANRGKPQVYHDHNMQIKASNLCVTGDQRVPSQHGVLTAKELYEIGSNLVLFDNQKQVQASPMRLVEKNADVYKVTLENGMSHTITDYHKLVVRVKDAPVTTTNVECKNLKIGDKVAIQTNKGVFGTTNMPKEAFLLGMYQADGTQHKDLRMIDVWEKDFDLLPELEDCINYVYCKYYTVPVNNRRHKAPAFLNCTLSLSSSVLKKRLSTNLLSKYLGFEKGFIPSWIWEADEETQWQYVRGLYYADGTVNKTDGPGEPLYLSITNINKTFLEELQILLTNLGVSCAIGLMREAGKQLLPDGNGGHAYYECKDAWRLTCGNKPDALLFEHNTGFLSRKGVEVEDRDYRDNTKKFHKIKAIEYVGKEDVYCTTVDTKEHLWVCNGFITHNCTEIMLPTDDNESFVCDLASMNILHFKDWQGTDAVKVLFYALDAVLTEYIRKIRNVKYMERALRFAERHRAIGLGWLGWHSFLQSNMIAFESMEAKNWNTRIAKYLDEQTLEASKELAVLFGEPELLKGYGLRNTTRQAIAPTTSSSAILGQVSQGIEPYESNYFTKDLAKGKAGFKNPFLEQLLESKGKNTSEVWERILKSGGSVQSLEFLSEHERNVFKTFIEISQREIVIQAIQRQRFIDQGQSLNLMISPNTPVREVSDLMIFGYENGIKAFYYQRGQNASQNLARSINGCVSCEA